MPDTPLPPGPPGGARATPAAGNGVPPSRETVLGTMTQALSDLSRITTQVTGDTAGWSRLAAPLRALSAELAQAADWLGTAAGGSLSTAAGGSDDHSG